MSGVDRVRARDVDRSAANSGLCARDARIFRGLVHAGRARRACTRHPTGQRSGAVRPANHERRTSGDVRRDRVIGCRNDRRDWCRRRVLPGERAKHAARTRRVHRKLRVARSRRARDPETRCPKTRQLGIRAMALTRGRGCARQQDGVARLVACRRSAAVLPATVGRTTVSWWPRVEVERATVPRTSIWTGRWCWRWRWGCRSGYDCPRPDRPASVFVRLDQHGPTTSPRRGTRCHDEHSRRDTFSCSHNGEVPSFSGARRA